MHDDDILDQPIAEPVEPDENSYSRFSAPMIFQYYVPLSLILFMQVTVKWQVLTDGAFDRMYGFPLPFRSSAFAFSFHYVVYLGPFLLNYLFYFGLVVLLFVLLKRVGFYPRPNWITGLLSSVIIALLISYFYIVYFESSFYWLYHIPFKVLDWQVLFGHGP